MYYTTMVETRYFIKSTWGELTTLFTLRLSINNKRENPLLEEQNYT